jgi:hypothetical protein
LLFSHKTRTLLRTQHFSTHLPTQHEHISYSVYMLCIVTAVSCVAAAAAVSLCLINGAHV